MRGPEWGRGPNWSRKGSYSSRKSQKRSEGQSGVKKRVMAAERGKKGGGEGQKGSERDKKSQKWG